MTALPVYVKTFKNLLPRTEAESLHKSLRTGGLPKLLIDGPMLRYDLFTVRSSLLPYAFVLAPYICMEKMLIISNDFSSEASGQCRSNFMWDLHGAGEQKIPKMVVVN